MNFYTNILKYEVIEGWGELPKGWYFDEVPGVAVDSRDRVYIFNRSPHPVIVFSREGNFITSWGEGIFTKPHSIYIDSKDNIFCVDSIDHTIRKFTIDGNLLSMLGTINKPGEAGAPFNRPTDVAISKSGEIYVSDGYVNSRLHKYSPDGRLLLSWGQKGNGPGQFDIPHGIWVDNEERVYVADRQNNRIQIFNSHGEFLDEWPDFHQPCSIFIGVNKMVYVSELQSRMSILNMDGELLARWGGEKRSSPRLFIAPHCAWADSYGDLYVGESLARAGAYGIQKFVLKT